jgi:hypothetical protein
MSVAMQSLDQEITRTFFSEAVFLLFSKDPRYFYSKEFRNLGIYFLDSLVP